MTDFGALQDDLGAGRTDRLVFYAFDLLFLDALDLRGAGLTDRSRILAELLDGVTGPIRLVAAHVFASAIRTARFAAAS